MQGRVLSTLRFLLERWILKGVFHQLLLMASLVVLVAVTGGLVAWATTSAFGGPTEAIWWAFLRLTDPGYLGDDEGAVLRTVSTAVTVLGYVLFMGSLIAILTQGLDGTLRRFESGLTPIRMKGHVVVLGWTNRTPEVVLKLLSARGRLQRFLARSEVHKLRVVILSDEVGAERRLALREHLGEHWSESRIFLRSGSSLQPEHLRRLDLARASTILVPGADFELGGVDASDTRVVKTLLTVNGLLRRAPAGRRPQVVCEVFDPLIAPLTRTTVEGDLEVVASNAVISRLVSQSILHRGLAQVLFGILSHRQGNSIYVRAFPELAGLRPSDLTGSFERAVVLGFVRDEGAGRRVVLEPLTDEALLAEDLLILLAESYDDCAPRAGRPQPQGLEPRALVSDAQHGERARRILVLGWSHKIGVLVGELDQSGAGRFELTCVSRVPSSEREAWLRRVDWSVERVGVRHLEADYALEKDLLALEPGGYDNVVFFASDWMESSSFADARTILGYVLLRSKLRDLPGTPEILIELLDPENTHLFRESDDLYIVTPRVLSHILAHVAMRPELNTVFDALFGAGGCEITLRSARELEAAGREVRFPELQRLALEHGVLALGLIGADERIELNPDRSRCWTLGGDDAVIVLATA